MNQYKMIALDIDGTLLNSRGEVTPRVINAVARAQRSGMLVTLATGRPLSTALPIAELLRITAPLIVSNGAVVACPVTGTPIHQQLLKPTVARQAVRILKGLGCPIYASQFRTTMPDLFYQAGTTASDEIELLGRKPESICRVGDIAQVVNAAPPLCLMTLGRPNAMATVARYLREVLAGDCRILVTPEREGYSLLEIAAPGVTKAAGLAQLVMRNGLSPRQIVAVGDNLNDLEMLRFVGLGVAMGNAVPELKAVAAAVTASNDEDGVADLMDRLLTMVA